MQDLSHVILPGFAAYGATRVIQRVAFNLVQKRWPRFGIHAHALSGLVTFAASWFGAHRIRKLAPYHDGVLVGTGIAALQGAWSAWVPAKYNWLMADVSPDDVAALPAASSQPTAQPSAGDGDEYSYLEEQLESTRGGGRPTAARAARRGRNRAADAPAQTQPVQTATDPDLDSILGPDENVDDLYSGSFAN